MVDVDDESNVVDGTDDVAIVGVIADAAAKIESTKKNIATP